MMAASQPTSGTITDFVHGFRGSNPFAKNRVSEIADADVDVPGINEKPFLRLKRRASEAPELDRGTGVLLVGGAGMGKSHLLARLCQWATRESGATAVFLHNVVASPEHMPRYLLRATISSLAGHSPEAYPQSRLYEILNRAIAHQLKAEGQDTGVPAVPLRLATLRGLGRGLPSVENQVMTALAGFLEAAADAGNPSAERRARAAVAWLSGESIEEHDAAALGLPVTDEEGSTLLHDGSLEAVFRVLARLARVGESSFILCVDQVDNLNDEQVSALAAFLHLLIDHTPNLLAIVSGVKQSMVRFSEEGVIPEAAWDRIAHHRVELARISPAEARELLTARIEHFMRPFRQVPELAELRRRDPLFPLDEAWLTRRLGEQRELRPRDVILWARDRWEEQQDHLDQEGVDAWLKAWPEGETSRRKRPTAPPTAEDAIGKLVRNKLLESIHQRKLRPETLPPDADNLAELAQELLEHCRGDSRYSLIGLSPCPARGKKPAYAFYADERRDDDVTIKNGVTFITTENKTAATYALKRMLEDGSPPDKRILVTDEERRPLTLGAKGREYYDQLLALENDRFLHIELDFESYAGLDALAGVLGSARVGDLELEYPPGTTRALEEASVLEALHRNNKFIAQPLLRELLTEEITGPEPVGESAVSDQDLREYIMAQLSWRLGLTTLEVAQSYMQNKRGEIPNTTSEQLHNQIVGVAHRLHAEKLLHATAQDDTLFLQLLKAP